MIEKMGFDNGGSERWKFGPPLGPIVGTIVALIGWLVFIVFYALFWSKGFDLFQNVIVTVASLMIVALLIALMWIVWLRMRGPMRIWRDAHNQTGDVGNPSEK